MAGSTGTSWIGRTATAVATWLRARVPDDRWSWGWWAASLAALASVPAAWLAFVFRRVPGCRNLEVAASYAGDPTRFVEYATGIGAGGAGDAGARCELTGLGPFHRHLAVGYAVTLYSLVVVVVLWVVWWRRAWITRRFTAASPVVLLAPFAAAADVLENIVQHITVGLAPGAAGTVRAPTIDAWGARVLPVLAWLKAIAVAAVLAAMFFTLIAAFSRRRVRNELAAGVERSRQEPAGLGICCSGGGIRAASISLGALGELERTRPDGSPIERPDGTAGILDLADYLASVSGGGYASGAWRVARGTKDTSADPATFAQRWPSGIVGAPDAYDDVPPLAYDSVLPTGDPTLFRHLQQRREFLRTGRGGLSGSLVIAALFLVVHLGLILGAVTTIAWAVGRLARTWYVFGGAAGIVDVAGRQLDVTWRLYGPAAVLGGLGLAVWLVTLVKWNTVARGLLRSAGGGLLAAAALTALLLVGIPVWLDVAYPWIVANSTTSALAGMAAGGGAVATVIGMMRKVLGPRVARLGGVLMGVLAVLYGTVIAAMSALGRGLFATGLGGNIGWRGWAGAVLVQGLGFFVLCPRWWSLHTLYRNRLRGAFATTRDRDCAPARLADNPDLAPEVPPLFPVRQRHEPKLAAYRGAPGPRHLICCSAARVHRTGTGVKALSFVLSADEAVFYDVDPPRDPAAPVKVAAQGKPLPVKAFSAPIEPWLESLGSKWARQAEGTVSAGISVSGAAVAPALGRMDMGTTNALLAALNLRLGTWFPNPRYVRALPDGGRVRFPWVRLSYVLKELFGFYDLIDHHLYVTDGGHRENLGLVELLRRRCRTIVCIDASGDTPGSYATLRQAVDLARLEVGADVDLDPLRARPTRFSGQRGEGDAPTWPDALAGDVVFGPSRMGVPGIDRPRTAHTVLRVTYRDPDGKIEGEGTIVHLAPVLFEDLDDQLLAFALEDPSFPHYSTGDQFLTEIQFRRLAQFGRCATKRALADERVRAAVTAAAADPPVGGSAGGRS